MMTQKFRNMMGITSTQQLKSFQEIIEEELKKRGDNRKRSTKGYRR